MAGMAARRYDASMSKLLIVKTGSAPEPIARQHGDFEYWFLEGLGVSADQTLVVDVEAGESLPADRSGLAGVLVTGSPAMVSHREPWSERAAAWIAEAHQSALPMLGVCFGHQLIAHALGGRVGPNPAGRRMGTKRVQIRSGAKALFDELGPVTNLHVTHLEAVLELPEGTQILADTNGDPHHALHFGQQSWGVQFHPEFSAEIMASYIELRADLLRDEGQCPDSLMEELEPTPDGVRLLRRFADRLESLPRRAARSEAS
jgi:GMP synthase (glutamine-hydrolysing)